MSKSKKKFKRCFEISFKHDGIVWFCYSDRSAIEMVIFEQAFGTITEENDIYEIL